MKVALALVAVGVLSCGGRASHLVPARAKPVTIDQLDQLPALVNWPDLPWTDSLRAHTDSARVVGQVVLDTSGRAERESFLAHGGTTGDLARLAGDVVTKAVFSPGRTNGKAQRVMVELSIDLIGRTATPSSYVSDALIPTSEMVEEKPEVLGGPAIVYPAEVRAQGITGRVLVRAILQSDGRIDPSSVRVLKSVHPDLDYSALYYVLHATFKPASWHGKKVRCIINLPIDFKIRGRS